MGPAAGIGATQRPRPIALSGGPAAEEPNALDTGAQGQPAFCNEIDFPKEQMSRTAAA